MALSRMRDTSLMFGWLTMSGKLRVRYHWCLKELLVSRALCRKDIVSAETRSLVRTSTR